MKRTKVMIGRPNATKFTGRPNVAYSVIYIYIYIYI